MDTDEIKTIDGIDERVSVENLVRAGHIYTDLALRRMTEADASFTGQAMCKRTARPDPVPWVNNSNIAYASGAAGCCIGGGVIWAAGSVASRDL